MQIFFLLESPLVALLGIGLGVALGAGMSFNVMDSMATFMPGLVYKVPWVPIVLVAAIDYGASLLTTYVPSRQAARVYPAEALRYE